MPYQAITTKYLSPTNVKGARIKAAADAGTLTISWDHALNNEGNHMVAAENLAAKLGWNGDWHCGAIPSSSGYVFVVSSEPAFKIRWNIATSRRLVND